MSCAREIVIPMSHLTPMGLRVAKSYGNRDDSLEKHHAEESGSVPSFLGNARKQVGFKGKIALK